ncbi:SDR family oxidoreductase [Mycobacterium sp. SMC-8]|uniref:SDR family NAD(P)-dependent oxidoreductase n=1 Tax=Mycobacterium sp. SMC-8 TaxID=2857060 RepID=UPI0021B1C6CE|nr:SDR family oxidoreductase [Mycobacterium sp. SMC-8]UXA15069.1 SDR family oxidoreductase [Mycobacterium sp. SMC-8]
MSSRFEVGGKVAVITGGGTGIGRGAALVLAQHGADVVLAGRRSEPLEQTADEVIAMGNRALPVSTDVTTASACQALIDTTLAEFGRVDILVNNAGGAETKPIKAWTEDEFERVLTLNFKAVWHLSRAAAVPMLEQGKGSIVNISSGASLLAMPQAAPYGAAKAAVNNLTGSMAAAWSRKGVRVNTIACGAVRAATLMDEAEKLGLDERTLSMSNGVGRLGEPDEIGYGVLFFASDASSFCSGQTLYMHGAPGPAGV